MIEITRRGFISGISAAAAGLALGVHRVDAKAAPLFAPNPFIQIGTDGVVAIICKRSEMGQGIRSSLPILIADELGADPAHVRIVQGDGDVRYGDQDTDGSQSIRTEFDELRQLGAVARVMLCSAAAKRWGIPASRCTTRDGAVHDGTRSIGFGELVTAAAALPVPKTAELRPIKELVHLGTELPLRDGPDYVTGRANYGADVRLPGMLTAVVAHPPTVLGKVKRFDGARAKAIAGVRHVVELPALTSPVGFQPLGGVAVIADHTWAAMRGRAALDLEWEPGPHADYDSTAYREQLLASVRAPGEVVRKVGDAEAALASAAKKVEAEYYVPHLAHAPMEPPAAVAKIDGGRCEIWAPTQSPQDAAEEVGKALGIDKSKVTVHVTFLGGGFGRKSKPDFIVEAALLARAAKAPVRVQWTRDDDIRHGYYHAVSAQSLAAGLDASGALVAWRHRVASPPISWTFDGKSNRPAAGNLEQGVLDLPLAIPNVSVQTGLAPAHVRIGWMRSVYNVPHAFAVQCFIDELATATKRDPRDMLLTVLGPNRLVTPAELGVPKLRNYGAPLDKHPVDVARLHRVIERVTDAAGWTKRGSRALGLAVHRSFLTYVAVVASVTKDARGEIRVDEAWIAADAGTIVNADRVRSQLEGAVIFGMSSAMHGAITAKAGAIEQRNFHDYRIVRMPEAPRKIHVEIIKSEGPPGGIGEPGVPPVAPAIANAVFALTGTRIRALPITPTPVT